MALNEGRHTQKVIRLEQLNKLFDMINNLNVEFTAGSSRSCSLVSSSGTKAANTPQVNDDPSFGRPHSELV